jgi:hypothetical protein
MKKLARLPHYMKLADFTRLVTFTQLNMLQQLNLVVHPLRMFLIPSSTLLGIFNLCLAFQSGRLRILRYEPNNRNEMWL